MSDLTRYTSVGPSNDVISAVSTMRASCNTSLCVELESSAQTDTHTHTHRYAV